MSTELTSNERNEIAEILTRRSNEIAKFHSEYRSTEGHFGSVELALSREMSRLRRLAERVNPAMPDDSDDD